MAEALPMAQGAAQEAPLPVSSSALGPDEYLCDGCHCVECCCDEIAADREAEYGKFCHTCGCDGEEGYANCPYKSRRMGGYKAGSCPQLTGMY